MAALFRMIHGSKQSTAGPAPNHADRENSLGLAATDQTWDRLRCLAERSSYFGHAMLITPILIDRHRARSFSVQNVTLRKKPRRTHPNRTSRGGVLRRLIHRSTSTRFSPLA